MKEWYLIILFKEVKIDDIIFDFWVKCLMFGGGILNFFVNFINVKLKFVNVCFLIYLVGCKFIFFIVGLILGLRKR